MRRVLREHGKLTSRVIERSRLCPGLTNVQPRFGGLLNIYARIGYEAPRQRAYCSLRQRGLVLRGAFMKNLYDTFPNQFQEVRQNNRFKPLLRYRKTGLLISLIFARNSTNRYEKAWIVETPKGKRQHTTLLVLLDVHGSGVESLWLFRSCSDRLSPHAG